MSDNLYESDLPARAIELSCHFRTGSAVGGVCNRCLAAEVRTDIDRRNFEDRSFVGHLKSLRPDVCHLPTSTRERNPKAEKTRTPNTDRDHDRGDQILGLKAASVDVEQRSDPGLSFGEEHVADDGTDDNKAGGGADAR